MAVTLHTGVRTATVGAEWSVWDTVCRLVVTDPWALYGARTVLEEQLVAIDRVASPRRRRRDGGGEPITSVLDERLGRGARPVDAGIGPFPYGLTRAPAGAPVHRLALGPGDEASGPAHHGVRAWAAQHCAEAVAEHTRCGVLVSIGDDVATSGLAPAGGWRIELGAAAGVPAAVVVVDGGAISRIGVTGARRSRRMERRDGDPTWSNPTWSSVTVAAATTTAARAACTGAQQRGDAAPEWLAGLGVPGQLIDADGVVRAVGGWPDPVGPTSDRPDHR